MIFPEHFGENRVILLRTVAEWWCIKLPAIFSGPLCSSILSIGLAILKVIRRWGPYIAELARTQRFDISIVTDSTCPNSCNFSVQPLLQLMPIYSVCLIVHHLGLLTVLFFF